MTGMYSSWSEWEADSIVVEHIVWLMSDHRKIYEILVDAEIDDL